MERAPQRTPSRVRGGSDPPPAGDRLVDPVSGARVLAWVLLIATPLELVLVMLLRGQGLEPTREGIAIAAVATATGWAILLLRNRLPRYTVPAVLTVATALQTTAVALAEDAPPAALFGYVWIALLAVYALPSRQAMLQVALAAAGHALAWAVVREPTSEGLIQWGLTLVTMSLAALVVVALKRRVDRLVANLADASRRDPLTGLPNRRGFHETMGAEIERARRSDRPLTVLLGDLDAFAAVNDRYGQDAGDRVLRTVADALEGARRRIDVATRVAGEEFAVVLPETDEHGGYVLADRLRRVARDAMSEDPAGTTISFGVASYPTHGPSVEGLLHGCYQALAVAKRLGPDRTVIYNPELSDELLQQDAQERVQGESHLAAVLVLAETLDMRDAATARHSQTVGRYAKLLGRELGLSDATVDRLHLAGILHDVGKVGVPDAILRKAGPLDEHEWHEMRKHPELGARILEGANLDDISGWVLAHHERPDGRGYPQGLMREEIPLPARILAVADAYEAMTADRVYRPAAPHEEAQAELLRCAGSQFDPAVVDAFVRVLHEHGGVAEEASA